MELLIIIWLLMGIAAAVIALSKNQNVAGFLVIGFVFGPLGILLAALAPRIERD